MAIDTIIMCAIASLHFLSGLNRKEHLGGRDRVERILPLFYLRLEGLALIIAQPTYDVVTLSGGHTMYPHSHACTVAVYY